MERKPNLFDKIGSLIPGYKGWVEREGRRECDRQLREQTADKLYRIEKKINDIIGEVDIQDLMTFEQIRKQIDNMKDTIKYMPYGESSMFADVVIGNTELEKIYQLDLTIIEATRDIENSLKTNQISNLKETIVILETAINNRNEFLKDM